MKKVVAMIVLIGVGFFIGSYHVKQKMVENEINYEKKLSAVNKEKDKYKVALEDTNKASDESVDKNKEERVKVLKDFSDKLLNSSSIDDRNRAIKEYLTAQCVKEQGIDVKVNADFDSSGTISEYYESTNDVNHYVLLGNDENRGAEHDVLIDVFFENNKINRFSIKYMELR
ncbi:EF0163 family protein [Enterococcus faecium]